MVSNVFWLMDWFVFSLLDFCLFVDDERNNNQLWQTVQEQIGGCSGAGGRTSGTPAYIFFSSAPPQILVLVIFGLFMVLFQFAMVTKLAYFMCSSILPLGWIFWAQDHRLWKWAKLGENGQTSGQKAPISSRPNLFSKSWFNFIHKKPLRRIHLKSWPRGNTLPTSLWYEWLKARDWIPENWGAQNTQIA